MARNLSADTPRPAAMSPEQMVKGIKRLERRIVELEEFNPENVRSFSDPDVVGLQAAIKTTLDSIFGTNSSEAEIFSGAGKLYNGSIWAEMSPGDYVEGYRNGKPKALSLLNRAKDLLDENLEDLEFQLPNSQESITADGGGLEVVAVRGQLDISDPPPTSSYKYNNLPEELPDKVANLTTSLTNLVEAVRGDNSLFADVLKKQLVILLETTASELKSPYTDTGKIKKAISTIRSVGENAAKKGAENFLVDKFNKAADGLADFLRNLL